MKKGTCLPGFSQDARNVAQSNGGFPDQALNCQPEEIGDIYYDQNLLRVMGKGQRERFVPFGRRVAKALMKYQMKYRTEPFGIENFWLRRDGQPY